MTRPLNLLLTLFFIYPAFAQASSSPQYVRLGDFKLESGDYIEDCRLAFRTFGSMDAEKSNVIIFPTWFGGKTSHVKGLTAPGKLIDSTKYHIIVIGAFGSGESSSPSTSRLQPGAEFPQFTIKDMVTAQHVFLTKHLKLDKVFAVIGGSMGSMQVFEWLVSYPDFMEKAVPYVCTPRVSAGDLLLHHTKISIIESGLRYGCPQDSIMGTLHALTQLTAKTTNYLSKNKSPEDIGPMLEKFYNSGSSEFTVFDYASQVRAMISHNIYKDFNNSPEETAGHIKAETLIIVSESDQIVNPLPALELAPLINAVTLIIKDNNGHLAVTPNMEMVSKAIDQFLTNTK